MNPWKLNIVLHNIVLHDETNYLQKEMQSVTSFLTSKSERHSDRTKVTKTPVIKSLPLYWAVAVTILQTFVLVLEDLNHTFNSCSEIKPTKAHTKAIKS